MLLHDLLSEVICCAYSAISNMRSFGKSRNDVGVVTMPILILRFI